ncbi:MAG TPA: hypothetical protein DD381_10305 [Lentisphaeria bacterium]|nr:hypothetical protein [Lentisphaeria bacterium]
MNFLISSATSSSITSIKNILTAGGIKTFLKLSKTESLTRLNKKLTNAKNTLFYISDASLLTKMEPEIKKHKSIKILLFFEGLETLIANSLGKKTDINSEISSWIETFQSLLAFYKSYPIGSYLINLNDFLASPSEYLKCLGVTTNTNSFTRDIAKLEIEPQEKAFLLCANDIITKNPDLTHYKNESDNWKMSPSESNNGNFKNLFLLKEQELALSNKSNEEKDKQILESTTQLTSAHQQITTLTNQTKDLQLKLDSTTKSHLSQVSDLSKSIEEKAKALAALELKLKESSLSSESYKSQLAELKTLTDKQIAESANKLASASKTLEEKNALLTKSANDLKASNDQINSLKTENSKLKTDFEAKLSSANHQITTLTNQGKDLQLKLASTAKSHLSQVSDLSKSIEEKAKALVALELKLKESSLSSESYKSQLAELKTLKDKQIVESANKLASASKTLEEKNALLTKSANDLKASNDQINSLKTENSKLKADFEAKLSSAHQQITTLTNQGKDLQLKLDSTAKSHLSQVSDLSKSIEEKAKALVALELKLKESSLSSETYKSQLAEKDEQLNTLKARTEELSKSLENKVKAISERDAQLTESEAKLKDLEAQLASASKTLEEKNTLLTKSTNDLKASNDQINSLKTENSKLKTDFDSKLSSTHQQITTLSNQNKDVQHKLDETSKASLAKIAELSKAIEEKSLQVADRDTKLSQSAKLIEEKNYFIADKDLKLAQFAKSNEEKAKTLAALELNLKESALSSESYKSQLAELKAITDKQITESATIIKTLKKQLANNEKQKNLLELEVVRTEAQIEMIKQFVIKD